ncbi:MAG: hypothetical protein U0X91_25105 [Spirosomataceae bacterium]
MTSSEEHSFENNWRKAFDNADEMPPASVWEQIEARLEEDDDRVAIIPLWQQWHTLKWVAAAGIALVLVSLGGWWLADNSKIKTAAVTVSHAEHAVIAAKAPEMTAVPKVAPSLKTPEKPTPQGERIKETEPKPELSGSTKREEIRTDPAKNEGRRKQLPAKIYRPENGFLTLKKNQSITDSPKNPTTLSPTEMPVALTEETAVSAPGNSHLPTATEPITISTSIAALSSLDSKEMRELIGLAKRQLWVAYQTAQSEPQVQKRAMKEYWASVGVMPASYNAGVVLGGGQNGKVYALSNQSFASNTSQTASNANKPLFSYALQWQGGVQLAQRWSLETGLNYLQGNSVFEGTNGFNVFSNSYVNNLEAAITNSAKQQLDFSFVGADKSQVQSLTTSQHITNSYQFLQVPVQAGYALVKPKRKFSLWLLAGFINNIFLKNSFQSGQESIVTVSGADNPYRPVSFSAGTGMRMQYKVNKRWTTLLSGNFQQALGSSTRSGTAFDAHPQLLGVGAGLRYGF